MDYHNRMMNIQDSLASYMDHEYAYKEGHRDARHAAAEIALEAQNEILELELKIETLTKKIDSLEFQIDHYKRYGDTE